jgi:hypothetical protein
MRSFRGGAGLELAVAHLTEAMEELVKGLNPSTAWSSVIASHLRDIRENFNRIVP